jgi:hypothetical protein
VNFIWLGLLAPDIGAYTNQVARLSPNNTAFQRKNTPLTVLNDFGPT